MVDRTNGRIFRSSTAVIRGFLSGSILWCCSVQPAQQPHKLSVLKKQPAEGAGRSSQSYKIRELLASAERLFSDPAVAKVAPARERMIFARFLSDHYLHDRYDYSQAILWIGQALAAYEELETKDTHIGADIHTAYAFAHHNIGKQAVRDEHLLQAQQLLRLPEEPLDAPSEEESPVLARFFIARGYQRYIRYEESNRAQEPIEQQEAHLRYASDCFRRAIRIAGLKSEDAELQKAVAWQGLGTVNEFLGKSAAFRGDTQEAIRIGEAAVLYFEFAYYARKQYLGEDHPEVARSLHKLARNKLILADRLENDPTRTEYVVLEHAKAFREEALKGYRRAIAIYDHNGVPKDHAKRKELEAEYEALLKQLLAMPL